MPALDAIGIVVKDVEVAARFYRLLGLDFAEGGGDHIEATAPGGLRVMLDALDLIKRTTPEWTEPAGNRIVLAFLCESSADVDLTFARITEAGYAAKTAPWDAFWGQRYAQVVDPDGNLIDLFAPL